MTDMEGSRGSKIQNPMHKFNSVEAKIHLQLLWKFNYSYLYDKLVKGTV
jgi:hypothetical protein